MSEYLFGLYRGHLSRALVRKIERKFRDVSVVNYTEPQGEKRGWFAGPNRGFPFDAALGREVLKFAREHATASDLKRLESSHE